MAEVWREVDEALDEFCVAVCPDDLRGCVSHDSAVRRELPLPRGNGGLGIPHVAMEAPIMAAGHDSLTACDNGNHGMASHGTAPHGPDRKSVV